MINDYKEVKECIYKDERFSVRDNGAIMRHPRAGKRIRWDDGVWTFGIKDSKTGYMMLGRHRVHIIVANAFHGVRDSKIYIVDHIDTNRCNNRAENLRWFTRLENILNNEITRNKIIYLCGSIEAFIENPKILQERIQLNDKTFGWMRTVTKNEAATAYENVKKYWTEQAINPKPLSGGVMNDNIYKTQDTTPRTQPYTINSNNHQNNKSNDDNNLISFEEWEKLATSSTKEQKEIDTTQYLDGYPLVQAKSPAIAWQKKWRTPTDFFCCPSEIGENTIEEYFNRLIIGSNYNSTLFSIDNEPSIQKVVDKAYLDDNNSIIVFSTNEKEFLKPFALSKIYIVDNKIIHESIKTYFSEDGARKDFTIYQGLEWDGGDTFDDYC